MKIPFILSANASVDTGGQGLNLRHMLEMFEKDFQVRLFARKEHAGVPSQVPPPSRLAHWIGITPVVRRQRGWLTWLADRQFDHWTSSRLHEARVFQGATGQCLASLRQARKSGMLAALDVVTLHARIFASELRGECREFEIESPIHPLMQRRMLAEYAEADAIRVMSHVARNTFLENGVPADKVFVATPPMNVSDFSPASFREPVFRVCFVGGIEPWKGFHHLIAAFENLGIQDSELELWGWTGAGKVRRVVEEAVRRNPRIKIRPEVVRQAGFDQVYGRASVFVLPSLTDGFGYVVAEAMAAGLPVIVTRRTGAADLIREGENGFVIEPRDVDALTDRLRFLASNPDRVREMGAAARKTAGQLTPANFGKDWLPRLKAGI